MVKKDGPDSYWPRDCANPPLLATFNPFVGSENSVESAEASGRRADQACPPCVPLSFHSGRVASIEAGECALLQRWLADLDENMIMLVDHVLLSIEPLTESSAAGPDCASGPRSLRLAGDRSA
ncbi:hypothetical protein OG462_44295 [Streptomyces sp. NBC_01077]|uniref:hypothetical protein n=1 Tax=Streptomyces sp. NBC_01077 TaxID=2903746 RepID=UPI0038691908|nr:hypothetical protein OG462_00710 [Streptomyces sp. NBC_01077]WSV43732.1 hypothetical protein OG462_44295 [Streptomyces sp. NBC_01077]